LIRVRVDGIFITQTQASGILLREENGARALPIVIGEFEAQAIAMALEHIKPPRPITHDLTTNILHILGVTLESILVTELKDNTYYAIIRLSRDSEIIEIDSRPSDAIALAVRAGAEIFVHEAVMDQAAYIPDKDTDNTEKFSATPSQDKLENLKQALQKAVEAEEYEKAAKLRDQIKKRESGS